MDLMELLSIDSRTEFILLCLMKNSFYRSHRKSQTY